MVFGSVEDLELFRDSSQCVREAAAKPQWRLVTDRDSSGASTFVRRPDVLPMSRAPLGEKRSQV